MKKITTVVKEYDTEGRLIKETTTEETEEETITTKEYIPYPYPYFPDLQQPTYIPVWTSPTIRPHRQLEITWCTGTGSGTYTPPSFINTNTVLT